MGVRGGRRRNILRITAWHCQAADMEICPTLLRVYNHGCEGWGRRNIPRITALHYQGADMEICSGCEGWG